MRCDDDDGGGGPLRFVEFFNTSKWPSRRVIHTSFLFYSSCHRTNDPSAIAFG